MGLGLFVARSLRPALRGWKQNTAEEGLDRPTRSPTRLEGMETPQAQLGFLNDVVSPTRLEGMETFGAGVIGDFVIDVSDPP